MKSTEIAVFNGRKWDFSCEIRESSLLAFFSYSFSGSRTSVAWAAYVYRSYTSIVIWRVRRLSIENSMPYEVYRCSAVEYSFFAFSFRCAIDTIRRWWSGCVIVCVCTPQKHEFLSEMEIKMMKYELDVRLRCCCYPLIWCTHSHSHIRTRIYIICAQNSRNLKRVAINSITDCSVGAANIRKNILFLSSSVVCFE